METNPSCDQLVNWLLGSLSLEATVFHAGRYCGAWQASTAGRLMGSFHLVLDGGCWLHRPGWPSVALNARDSVLFLRNVPHHLSPEPDARVRHPAAAMLPLEADAAGGTGLACGFFRFRGAISGLLIDSLPDVVLIRAGEEGGRHVATVFDLLRAEAGGEPERPSPLLARLVELLFFYAIRRVVARDEQGLVGIWALARTPKMATLLSDVLADPCQDWTVDDMARRVHMSRANFYRRFVELGGQPPAAFLTTLRMRIAAQRLESGDSIERTASHVGYRSSAAFSRAFKKATGEQPGAWRRGSRVAGAAMALQ